MEHVNFRAAWLRRRTDQRSEAARRLGTTANHLRNIAYGMRRASPALAFAIEREFGSSRRDLRPDDWGDIWPELIDEEHPWPVPAAVQAAANAQEVA